MGVQPIQQRTHAGPSQRDRAVGSSVVDIECVAIGVHRVSAREDDVVDVAVAFVVGFRAKDPRISSQQAFFRILKIEERHTQPVQTARRRVPDSVVEHEPSPRSLDRRRRQPNFVGVPPGALARFQHEPVPPPVAQVGRIGNPDVCSEVRHGPMNQGPESIDSPGQKRCIFIVRRHDDAVALEAVKVFGERQRNSRATARIGGVSDCILLQFGHESDARILDAPDFLGILLRVGHQCRLAIDLPSIDAILRARGAQMR